MAAPIKDALNQALHEAIHALSGDRFTDRSLPMERCVFGPTKSPEHGDLATGSAMVISKPLGRAPLDVAQDLANALAQHPLVASAEVAKPGFVNLRLAPAAFAEVLSAIAEQGAEYGDSDLGAGQTVLLEFVSANPTGPMHLGHCRHAASGDALARLLRAVGYTVTTEFYINDAGAQIQALGRSFRFACHKAASLLRAEDMREETDENGRISIFHLGEKVQYTGDYMDDFAHDFVKGKSAEELLSYSAEEYSLEARNRNLEMIKRDLAAFGVVFDNYVSEKALHESGAVAETLVRIRQSGRTYEKEDALWLMTQDFGDTEDRVMVKGDGAFTYLVPDVAYHDFKFQRGFDKYINVFGADHSGYPPRLRAGIAALGHDEKKLSVLFLRLVFLMRNGVRVKFSKRAGNFVALADVVEEAGSDVTRWFMLSRSIDSEFEFDMDLAIQNSSQNPVFKVQYAHARICSLEHKALEEGFSIETDATKVVGQLTSAIERDMILYLSQFPGVVERSARDMDVHQIPSYLLGLADLWNRYYTMAKTDDSFRIRQPENPGLTNARLHLANAIRRVIANGLGLMGIGAPVKMHRESSDDE